MTHTNLLQQAHLKPLTIAIWGYGAEGRATHHYFTGLAAEHTIVILDDKPIAADQLVHPSATRLTGEQGQQTLLKNRPDLLVRSPGITRYHPLLEQLAAQGTQLTTSTNIWFHDNPTARTLVVTGSKGKSTTASLIHHTLITLGFDASLLGNYGTPLIGQPAGGDFTVLELSSYQTSDLQFAPDTVTLTNLFEEHLEWHGGVAQYHQDKWRIADLSPAPTLIINTHDSLSCARFQGRDKTRYFSHGDIQASAPNAQSPGLNWHERVAVRHFRARGKHNHSNLSAALTTVDAAIGGISATDIDYDTLPILPHRLTEHALAGELLCVDDSISTIPQAVLAALSVYVQQPVHLYMGGYDRGVDFGALIDQLAVPATRNIKQLILFGKLGQRLADELATAIDSQQSVGDYRMTVQPTLGQAIDASFAHVSRGDALLLSPGGASYDEFSGFAERGNLFVSRCGVKATERFGHTNNAPGRNSCS